MFNKLITSKEARTIEITRTQPELKFMPKEENREYFDVFDPIGGLY
jgi:hypothetical protein